MNKLIELFKIEKFILCTTCLTNNLTFLDETVKNFLGTAGHSGTYCFEAGNLAGPLVVVPDRKPVEVARPDVVVA